MKPTRKRRYTVLRVNCDCSAYSWARSPLKTARWPRCRECGRALGFMQYEVIGRVTASSEREACELVSQAKGTP